MARLVDVMSDEDAPAEVFRLLTDDPAKTLPEVAKLWGVPKGRFVEWFSVRHADLYDTALKVIAADLAIRAMQAAIDATPEDVAVRKLQADVALKLASRFDRMRFGESVRVERTVSVTADAGLIGTMGRLLSLVASGQRPLRIVGEASGAAEVPPADGARARLPGAEDLDDDQETVTVESAAPKPPEFQI